MFSTANLASLKFNFVKLGNSTFAKVSSAVCALVKEIISSGFRHQIELPKSISVTEFKIAPEKS
jgi:hypothetical protein